MYELLRVVNNIIGAILYAWFAHQLMTTKLKRHSCLWLIAVCALLHLGVLAVYQYFLMRLLLFMGGYLIITYLWFSDGWRLRLLSIFAFLLFMVSAEAITLLLMVTIGYFIHVDMNLLAYYAHNLQVYLFISWTGLTLLGTGLYATVQFVHKKLHRMSPAGLMDIFLILSNQIFFLFFGLLFAGHTSAEFYLTVFFFQALFSTFALLIMPAIIKKFLQQSELESANANLSMQLQLQVCHHEALHLQLEAFRKLRHDIINHVETVKALHELGYHQQAEVYLSKLQSTMNQTTGGEGMQQHGLHSNTAD